MFNSSTHKNSKWIDEIVWKIGWTFSIQKRSEYKGTEAATISNAEAETKAKGGLENILISY